MPTATAFDRLIGNLLLNLFLAILGLIWIVLTYSIWVAWLPFSYAGKLLFKHDVDGPAQTTVQKASKPSFLYDLKRYLDNTINWLISIFGGADVLLRLCLFSSLILGLIHWQYPSNAMSVTFCAGTCAGQRKNSLGGEIVTLDQPKEDNTRHFGRMVNLGWELSNPIFSYDDIILLDHNADALSKIMSEGLWSSFEADHIQLEETSSSVNQALGDLRDLLRDLMERKSLSLPPEDELKHITQILEDLQNKGLWGSGVTAHDYADFQKAVTSQLNKQLYHGTELLHRAKEGIRILANVARNNVTTLELVKRNQQAREKEAYKPKKKSRQGWRNLDTKYDSEYAEWMGNKTRISLGNLVTFDHFQVRIANFGESLIVGITSLDAILARHASDSRPKDDRFWWPGVTQTRVAAVENLIKELQSRRVALMLTQEKFSEGNLE